MKQLLLIYISLVALIALCSSCGEIKRINQGNYVFQYIDNQVARVKNNSIEDSFYVYKIDQPLKSKFEDKTDYLIIKNNSPVKATAPIACVPVKKPMPGKIQMNGVIYSTESDVKELEIFQRSFTYTDIKFAVQTLNIPLKFRKSLDDGTKYPKQVETGINVGFAPVVKWNCNVFNPTHKIMGKSLNQYSINTGLLLNLGATDLKTATNAPGLKSDRKAAAFSYGTFISLGVNNINFGYAIGWDKILGEGHSNWVYQNKLWHGIIIGLDIIKP